MSEALERLKDIGAQKIYEDTHIPVEHVQAVLYESFEDLNKIQFLGFVSILEREYAEDLSGVRSRGIDYFNEKNSSEASMSHTLFQASENKKKVPFIAIIIIVMLLIAVGLYVMQSTNAISSTDEIPENPIQESTVTPELLKTSMVTDSNESENNSSDENLSAAVIETNSSLVPEKVKKETLKESKAVVHSLKIIARRRVWLGYIDVATGKKYQKSFKGEFELDAAKEWLFYFGHGYVDVLIDGKREKFNLKNTLRLHYKNAKIEKISIKEFRKLNRGRKW